LERILKIPVTGPVYDCEEIDNIRKAAKTFYNVEGEFTDAFAKGLCKFLGMKYCVLCNSGSSANLLAVSALNLPEGCKAITTACGFPTTLNPIIQNNLIPVFVDIDCSLTVSIEKLENALAGRRVGVIVLSHTLGNPCDMTAVMRLAKKYDCRVIEDNCDALGSKWDGKLTGTFGDISTLSFYPAHHITTGEGGACLTNDPLLYRKMMSLRNWGRDCICKPGQDNVCGKRFGHQFGNLPFGYDHKYVYTSIGYNLKMTNLQAAIGVAQLKKLPRFIRDRKRNYNRLKAGLGKSDLVFPRVNGDPSWFGFPVFSLQRDALVKFLENKGIATRMMFGGNLIKQPAYKNIKYECYECYDTLGYTDFVMRNLFWIGCHQGLDDGHINYVLNAFNEFMEGA